METMKDIVQILSGLLTPLIAILAGYIAWQQYRTARDKLKLDLYDRRFRVYRGLMDFLHAVIQEGSASRDALGKYYSETNEKKFLFDADVTDYMEEVRDKAVRLRQVGRKIENLPENQEQERSTAIDEDAELCQWFEEQAEERSTSFNRIWASGRICSVRPLHKRRHQSCGRP